MTPEIEEVWHPVEAEGFEGLYQVSNLGRVRSLDRLIRRKDGSSENKRGRIMKQHGAGRDRGYLFVTLRHCGKQKMMYVHRLVAFAFLPPSDAPHVNHIDLDKTNNVDTNLEWVTPKENTKHAIDSGQFAIAHRAGRTLGMNNPKRRKKLTPEDVADIRKACANGERQSDIGARFGITQSNVSRIHLGKNWGTTAQIKCFGKSASY